MLHILRNNDENFRVNVNDTNTELLNMEELFKVMMELEVEFEEIEIAVTELIRQDHKIANFGMNRTFLFSK